MGKRRHRRDKTHDYRQPFIYHIIFTKHPKCEPFGRLIGDAGIPPGSPGCASVNYTPLGSCIARELYSIHEIFTPCKVITYQIMPDHVHFIFHITRHTDKHLGDYMRSLKGRIAQLYMKRSGKEDILPSHIFEEDYCDRPLYRYRKLDMMKRYIKENPHRLAMRRQYPYFFRHIRALKIGDRTFQAYGNLFHLRNPDKMQLQIHRATTETDKEAISQNCMEMACAGVVMVSPFISKAEKQIRTEIEKAGGNIILITHEEFGQRFKPAEHNFGLCSEGRLLIISIGLPKGTPLSRDICFRMNELAAEIAKDL